MTLRSVLLASRGKRALRGSARLRTIRRSAAAGDGRAGTARDHSDDAGRLVDDDGAERQTGEASAGARGSSPFPAAAHRRARSPPSTTRDYHFCNRHLLRAAARGRHQAQLRLLGDARLVAAARRPVLDGDQGQALAIVLLHLRAHHRSRMLGAIRTWGGTQTLCTGRGAIRSDERRQRHVRARPRGAGLCQSRDRRQAGLDDDRWPKARATRRSRRRASRGCSVCSPISTAMTAISTACRIRNSPRRSRWRARPTAFRSPTTRRRSTTSCTRKPKRTQLAVGLTFCNRTQDAVWAALARETAAKKMSKGWWHLQPGQCEKVIRDRLSERFVYAFAEHSGDSHAAAVEGAVQFLHAHADVRDRGRGGLRGARLRARPASCRSTPAASPASPSNSASQNRRRRGRNPL